MVTRRENIRKYIQVIIEQLPHYFHKYSVNDQKYLTHFLEPLSYYEEVDNNREKLAERLRNSQNQFLKGEIYVKHPFSWFAVTFFENAEVALQYSSFHADDFFDYILPILRGTAGEDDGVFQLIRKSTSLDDLKWENLQYVCSKLRVPLTINQLRIVYSIYELIRLKPWNVLRPRRLRSMLLSQDKIPISSRELPKLFNTLNAFWTVWPYYPAFGLKSLFFQCKLEMKINFDDIMDLGDKQNHVLQTSLISSIRNKPNEYMGVIILPTQQHEAFQDYLKTKMSEGLMKSFQLDEIIENRWSYSLNQYQTETGWQEVPKTQWDQAVHIMKLKSVPRRRKPVNLSFLTPKIDTSWKFFQLNDPCAAIRLICENNLFNFNDLLTKTYPPDDIPLMKSLFEKQVLFLDFNPIRLRDEYSLDVYWIKTPKISLYQVKKLLDLVPDARIAFTKNNCYIRTLLSNYMVRRITGDLDWTIYPLLPAHNTVQRNINMFNEKSVRWRIPRIFTD
jgi:hypothetical protein